MARFFCVLGGFSDGREVKCVFGNRAGRKTDGTLCRPCVISLLVAALYNVVDQVFIANASYLGSFGNAANTVVFPMTVIALAIAVMIGDGCCAFVSLSLGGGRDEDAHKSIGSAIILCILSSIVLAGVYLVFMEPILTLFGGRVNEETYACAKEYFFWITLGVPLYMFGQAMNPIIRSDGSPRFAMAATLAGAATNLVLDPIFIYPLHMGNDGRCGRNGVGTGFNSSTERLVSVSHEGCAAAQAELRPVLRLMRRYLAMGLTSFLSQIALCFPWRRFRICVPNTGHWIPFSVSRNIPRSRWR